MSKPLPRVEIYVPCPCEHLAALPTGVASSAGAITVTAGPGSVRFEVACQKCGASSGFALRDGPDTNIFAFLVRAGEGSR